MSKDHRPNWRGAEGRTILQAYAALLGVAVALAIAFKALVLD